MADRVWIEVKLDNVVKNFEIFKKKVNDKVKLMPVIKGNAHGHGVYVIAKVLELHGAWGFGVAYLEEALELRKKGIKTPILILGISLGDDAEYVINYDLTQTVSSLKHAAELSKIASKLDRKVKVHLKVDTGLHRLGVDWGQKAVQVGHSIASLPTVKLEGIFTHFSNVYNENSYKIVEKQLYRLLYVKKELASNGVRIPLIHAAATGATLLFPETHLNMVRIGCGIYGMVPLRSLRKRVGLKETLTLKTKIVFLKTVPAGENISYGDMYITKRPSRIATIPVGFDDVGQLLSKSRRALVRNKEVPIIGVVPQNFSMLDVTEVLGIKEGDEVVLLGTQGDKTIDMHEVVNIMGVALGEVYSALKANIPRIYIGQIN